MATADVHGAQASPKGLRHGYGVHAVCSGVQLNMLRKWMGHASINTHVDLCQRDGEGGVADCRPHVG